MTWLALAVVTAVPGFIEVDGGVAQEAYATDSPGWRCDADNPLKVTIEGKALIYVALFSTKNLTGKRPAFKLTNGEREVILDGLGRFARLPKPDRGQRSRLELALDVSEGPQPYTLRCPKGAPFLVKMFNVERAPKKVPQFR